MGQQMKGNHNGSRGCLIGATLLEGQLLASLPVRGLGRPQAHQIGQVRYGLLDELGTKTAEFRVRD